MKYNATVGLTSVYLQKSGRQNRFATGVAVLIVTASLLWMLFHIGGDRTVSLFSGTICTLGSLVGASWAWITAYRMRRGALKLEPRYQFAWLLVGLGLLADGLGRAYFTYLEYNGQLNPTPTYADVGFTLFYPCVFAGLILMITDIKPLRACMRMGLDSLITTLCILGINWYFIINPIIMRQSQAHVATARLISVLSYPFWDVLLILAIMLIIRHCTVRVLHHSLFLCAAGLFAIIWADIAHAYFTALGTYHSGTFYVDLFWLIGPLLIGLSGRYQYASLAHKISHERTNSPEKETYTEYLPLIPKELSPLHSIILQIALIFLPLGILLALTIGSEVIDDKARTLFLLLLIALIGIVVAVRYLLTTYENKFGLQEREQQLEATDQLYQQLQTTHQRLRELDQLKDQLLMTASHELRTPLTSVQGYLALMAQFHDQLPAEKRREYLQKAQRSCDVLVILLSNVMDASRLEVESSVDPAQLEQVSVQDILQSVMNLIEPRVTQERREISLSIPPDLSVRTDPGQLRQVLLNISMNALKYSPPGSPIAFSAQVAPDSNSNVVISVTDKGKGIAPQDQARVFQRFVRLERDMNSSIRGSGLGLYIAHRLIEAMGGKIRIESKGIPGEGTTFHIQLPKA